MSLSHELRYLASLAEYARTGPKDPPQRLSTFLRRNGGVKDWNGEVSAFTGGKFYSCGKLIRRNGMDLDTAAMAAWEAGYIPSDIRPTPAEFLDWLAADIDGEVITSADDAHAHYEWEQAEMARQELDKLGILGRNKTEMLQVECALVDWANELEARPQCLAA